MTDLQPTTVQALRRYITDEIFIAMGFGKGSWPRKLLWPVFWPPAHRFAELAVSVDYNVEQFGICEAAHRVIERFVTRLDVLGTEKIPSEGPLLVASNHPGAFDSVCLISSLGRDDLKVIASDVPFLRNLPALRQQLIYTTFDVHDRMGALRASVRHLRGGGALLVFASGFVDPDPAVLPGAKQELSAWSSSLELFLRKVPETQLLISIVSGVLAPACIRNPLTHLPKERWERQKLAEFFQVMQQLFFPHSFNLTPIINFAGPYTIDELDSGENPSNVMAAIIERASALLPVHSPNRPYPSRI